MGDNKRKIGLKWCNRVSKILGEKGHKVDGPFNKTLFRKGRKFFSHVDIGGCYDLISFKDHIIHLHQVTAPNMKSRKLKKMRELGVRGLLWCYYRKKGENSFRVFIHDPQRGEGEISLEEI